VAVVDLAGQELTQVLVVLVVQALSLSAIQPKEKNMSHFAKVVNGQVEQVIVAEQEFIDALPLELGTQWIQTSYNTCAGQHLLGGKSLRKNYAVSGHTYNSELDAFIPPKPFADWILNTDTCTWTAPEPYPADGGHYIWNPHTSSWQATVSFPTGTN
jgi:hypothetical protein